MTSEQQLEFDEFKEKISTTFQELYDESSSGEWVSNLEIPWQDAKHVKIHFFWGDRNQAKSSAMEQTAEYYYNEGLNIWHLWAARSFENLFWAINRNCRLKWQDGLLNLTDNERSQLKPRLHCNCHKAYPIIWIVPNYIEIDKDSLKRFNGINWASWDDYRQAVNSGLMPPEINHEDRKLLFEGKLRKPDHLQPDTELIKVAQITVPSNAETKHAFDKEFIKIVLDARKQRRIVVMNPQIFDGATDKFKVIARIFELIPDVSNEYFTELTEAEVGKMRGLDRPIPKSEWTKQELSWDKICVVINELRTIAPTSKMNPQVSAGLSKRPIVDMIPELRHFRCWFLGDLQMPDDLNQSVRPQANNVIIKQATKELLGDEWKGFFARIEELRRREFAKRDIDVDQIPYEYIPDDIKDWVNDRFPRIEQLPKNKGYIVYRNGEFFLETFDFPSFHHKTEEEKFPSITHIKWKRSKERLDQEAIESDESILKKMPSKNKKALQNLVLRRAVDYRKEGNSWEKVAKKIAEDVQNGIIAPTGIEKLDGKHLSNKIGQNPEIKKLLDQNDNSSNLTP